MSELRDGGPAFPAEYTNERLQQELIAARNGGASLSFFDIKKLASMHPGMSLRDYAAIHADVEGIEFPNWKSLASYVDEEEPDTKDFAGLLALTAKAKAKLRYMYADAMLAAREVRS